MALTDTDKVNDYELFQSALQVHLTTGPEDQQRQDELITVHIYHTNGKKPSVRTVLAQGFRCPQWVESEFEAIKRCVHEIAFQYIRQSCMLKAALTANIQKALMPPGEETPAVSSSDRTPGNEALAISFSSSHDNGAEPMTTITPSSSSDAQRELETTHISSSPNDVKREHVTSSPSSDTPGMPMNTTPSSPLYNARGEEETTPTLSPSVDAWGKETTQPVSLC